MLILQPIRVKPGNKGPAGASSLAIPFLWTVALFQAHLGPLWAQAAAAPASGSSTKDTNNEFKLADDPKTKLQLQIHHKLAWIDGPELVRGFGEQKLITGCLNTWDKPNEVSVSTNFSHLFEFDAGDELIEQADVSEDAISALLAHESSARVLRAQGHNMTRFRGRRSLVRSRVLLEKRSMSVVLFRDNTIELRGRVRKTLDKEKNVDNERAIQAQLYERCMSKARSQLGPIKKVDCHKQVQEMLRKSTLVDQLVAANKVEEFDLLVRSSEIDSNGTVMGTFSVDYFGTEQYKHPAFYSLTDRYLNVTQLRPADDKPEPTEQVRSPFACAELALAAGRSIAMYDVNKMRCLINGRLELEPSRASAQRDKLPELGQLPTGEFLFDRSGNPLGEYAISKWAPLGANASSLEPAKKLPQTADTISAATSTGDRKLVRLWTDGRKCDLINLLGGQFQCVRLAKRMAYVVMFRRQLIGVPTNSSTSLM